MMSNHELLFGVSWVNQDLKYTSAIFTKFTFDRPKIPMEEEWSIL